MALNVSLQSIADTYCHLATCEKLVTNTSRMFFKLLLYKQEKEIQTERDMKKAYKIIQYIYKWVSKFFLFKSWG